MDALTALLLCLVVVAIGNYFLSTREERSARRRALGGFVSVVMWSCIALLALVVAGRYLR